jgi:large subunit ribosomal protein L10
VARPEKVAVVDRVSEQLSEAEATLLTDYRGLTVSELAELRAELRKVDATYTVVKNTLTRLAAAQAGMEGLEDILTGPTAIVLCGEDPVGPAKAIKAFAKDHEALVLKGGYFEGEVLDAEAAMKLAELASREELLAMLAGMMNNALAGFARLLQAPLSDMARLAAALEEDGGVEAKGFTPSAPVAEEPAPEEPAAEEPALEEPAAEEEAPGATGEATEEPPVAEEADDVADSAAESSDASSASSDSSDSDDSDDSADEADEDDD